MQQLKKLKNLCKSSADRLSDATALSLYYLDEVARFLVYGCDGKDDFLQKYVDIREDISLFDEPAAAKITDAYTSVCSAEQGALFSYLCKAVCSYVSQRGNELSIEDFFDNQSQGNDDVNVAYVRSVISDAAYRIFEKAINGATVVYTTSFAAACEEVYYGRVAYCILPYETSDEGTLSGFTRMMRKYELYPKYVCSVRNEMTVTKVALLCRNPSERTDVKGVGRYLRITLDSTDFYTFSRLSAASAAAGLKLTKSESIPVSWDDGKYGFSLTFDITEADVVPFLLYLALEVPECSDKAIYYELN